jgi:hypothetical protein
MRYFVLKYLKREHKLEVNYRCKNLVFSKKSSYKQPCPNILLYTKCSALMQFRYTAAGQLAVGGQAECIYKTVCGRGDGKRRSNVTYVLGAGESG